ncbi:MAG: hypothetical protein IJZ61_00060 [Oscillospiraceae bacterium]|nr:hypothetical protein [Oscillospiraceae bacterium]
MKNFICQIGIILICCVMLTACGNNDGINFKTTSATTEDIITGVMHTSNYIDDYESYCHSYLIPSQYELNIFQEYMREPVFLDEIDFDKYCVAVIPIQLSSAPNHYVCDGVTIEGNKLTLSYYYMEETTAFSLCIMAMDYPYALIPKEMLTEKSYEGWVIPSEADTNEYYMSYLNGSCAYDRETVEKALEICRKHNAFSISGKIMNYHAGDKLTFTLYTSSNNFDDIIAMQTELEAIGFYEMYGREVQVTNRAYVAEPPSFPLAFEKTSCVSMLIETESREDEQEAMEYAQSFGGETYYEDIYDLYGSHISRRWGIPMEDMSDVYDMFEFLCSAPDISFEAETFWISVDFDFAAN